VGTDPEAALRDNYKTFFFKPYAWQKRALDVVREKNTIAVVSSNKIGKTCFGANIVISWCVGYEPWQYDDEGVEVGGFKYRKSSLGIEPPVDIIVTGEDWKIHIGVTLVKELKKWLPVDWYTTKKNELGIEYKWTFYNGSTITIMCYSQDDSLFESFRAQGILMDEPPPKSKYDAMSRGLLLDCGKTLLTLTPLKEAWILDEIVLSDRTDIGVVDGLVITANEDLYESDRSLLAKTMSDEDIKTFFQLLLYNEKGEPVEDRGAKAEAFVKDKTDEVNKLKILKFIKDIDPSDVPPRVFGQFKSLVGRVLKEFDFRIHLVEPFDVPSDWPVVAMVDFHLSKPQAVSYWAVNRQDVRYCLKETWRNMSAGEIADDIIRTKLSRGLDLESVFIDPLSKGDVHYMRNMAGYNLEDAFSQIEHKLVEHGISLFVASKDKTSGIKNIKEWLRGVNGLPICYIFNNCERHKHEVMRWIFDDEGLPAKNIDDHFMENWYRYTLTGSTYEANKIYPLPAQTDRHWMAM